MTVDSILENTNEVWSFIDDDLECDLEKKQKVEKYKKVSRKRYTLVFDVVDLFIEIFDPSKSNVSINSWQYMNQLYCKIQNKFFLFTYRACFLEMAIWLELLAREYELVIYSILPLELIKKILENVENSSEYISHILSFEDLTFVDGYAVKDLILLKEGRLF